MAARPDWDKLRGCLQADWSPERASRVEAGLQRRQQRTRRSRQLALLGILALVAVGAWQLRQRVLPGSRPSNPATPPQSSPEVVALSPATRLQELHFEEGGPRGYRLVEGSARFVVPRGWARPFRVVAGDVTVEHLGTTFTVEMLRRGRVRVGVEEGRVRVRYPGGVHQLGAGERWESPPLQGADTALPLARPRPASRPASRPRPLSARAPAWKRLAEAGAFHEAFRAMSADGESIADVPGDLLLAADAARLSGHPEQAVRFLRQAITNHPRDARAPLAAFTLGRVLADELGRPREAAAAFAQAMAAKDLAEDALARQVQALAQAGDQAGARRLAELYAARYPGGRRLRAVKKFGGLR